MKHNNPIHISEQLLRTIIEGQEIDLLFECFASLLIKSAIIEENDIHVLPVENNTRNYNNDIIPIPKEETLNPGIYFEEKDHNALVIHTSRSAILDYLPENLYADPNSSPPLSKNELDEEKVKKVENLRKKVQAELKSAERFFRPLEIEYNKFRIRRELNEINQQGDISQIIAVLWKEFPIKNDRWKRFVQTLHLVPFILGNQDKTKALIAYVLDTAVSLTFTTEACFEHQQKSTEKILGFNTLLGNTIYDYLEVCILKIEHLSTEDFTHYFDKESDARKLLNEIINYYFPLNLEVRLDFSIKPPIEEDGKEKVIILGYSSKLEAIKL